MLRQYNGKATNIENTDLATNYLGYWMDNGAYYYYNPLPNTSYQDTVLELHANLSERIPVRCNLKESSTFGQVCELRLLVVPERRGSGGEGLVANARGVEIQFLSKVEPIQDISRWTSLPLQPDWVGCGSA